MLQIDFSDEEILWPPPSPASYAPSPPPLTSSFTFSYVLFPPFPAVFLGQFFISSSTLPIKEKKESSIQK